MFTGVSRIASIFSSLNCLALPFGRDFAYASRCRWASSCIVRRVSAERMTTKSQGWEWPTLGAVGGFQDAQQHFVRDGVAAEAVTDVPAFAHDAQYGFALGVVVSGRGGATGRNRLGRGDGGGLRLRLGLGRGLGLGFFGHDDLLGSHDRPVLGDRHGNRHVGGLGNHLDDRQGSRYVGGSTAVSARGSESPSRGAGTRIGSA